MRYTVVAAAVVAAALSGTAALAAPLQVQIDHSQRLSLPGAAGTVLVGNPAVADVTVVDSRTVFISGRGYGVTNLVVLDRNGATLFDSEVIVGGQQAMVALYRGPTRSDYACANGCQATVRLTSSSGQGSSSSPPAASPPGGVPGGALGGVGGMASGALNGVARATGPLTSAPTAAPTAAPRQ